MLLVTIAVTLTACDAHGADTIASAQRTLIDNRQWRERDAIDDPLPSHQPDTIRCGLGGWFVEYDQIEIDTGRCNYPLLEHPALIAVAADTRLSTQLTYYDLEAVDPAEAHFAIVIGDVVQWETTVAIPQAGRVLDVSWRTPTAIESGDPIVLHLHNHGQNHWALATIMADVPTP